MSPSQEDAKKRSRMESKALTLEQLAALQGSELDEALTVLLSDQDVFQKLLMQCVLASREQHTILPSLETAKEELLKRIATAKPDHDGMVKRRDEVFGQRQSLRTVLSERFEQLEKARAEIVSEQARLAQLEESTQRKDMNNV